MTTDTGEPCQLPFTINDSSYNHCVPGTNYVPQCKTLSGVMRNCSGNIVNCNYISNIVLIIIKKVPTNAVIFGVTTKRGGIYTENGASLNGKLKHTWSFILIKALSSFKLYWE